VKEFLSGWATGTFIYILIHYSNSSNIITAAIVGLIGVIILSIISWKKRYKEYQELALIFGAIEEVQSELSL